MTKKRASKAVIGHYIRLPKGVRKWTDPIVKGHKNRSEKGKKKVKKVLRGRL